MRYPETCIQGSSAELLNITRHLSIYNMQASTLVDFLLELNVLNANDIDNEVNQLAARLSDPRAKAWFKRTVRFFLINIDRLAKEPYVAKAEPRSHNASKYYYDPKGGWRSGQEPKNQPTSPIPIKEEYDPEEQTYTSMLHQPAVQRDIDQSYAPFNPRKAKAKGLFGGPPTKGELAHGRKAIGRPDLEGDAALLTKPMPWATAPGSADKEFHHFDPIGTRRRELFQKLEGLVNYLNYLTRISRKTDVEDPAEAANSAEAEKTLHGLLQIKTDDIHGFRNLMKEAAEFRENVKTRPELYTNDGKVVARHGNFTMRKAMTVDVAMALMLRAASPTSLGTFSKAVTGGYSPSWCVNQECHCRSYLSRGGAFYVIYKGEKPYVLAHIPGSNGDVRDVRDQTISDDIAEEIAPLFMDQARFPQQVLQQSDAKLASFVARLREQQPRR